MDRIKNFFYFFGIFFILSCTTNKSEFEQAKTINHISYTLCYNSKNDNKSSDKDSLEPADLLYYKLTISDEEKESNKISELYLQSNYNKLLYYINKNIEFDFKTILNGKEYNPVLVYFESNNRMTKKLVFMLAFEKPKEIDGDLIVEFNDNIFNNGKIKFKYNLKELI